MNTCIDFAEQSGDIVMVIVKTVIFKNITQRTDLQNLTRRMTMAEKEYIERGAIIQALKDNVTEMESDIYYGSNKGVPKDDIEDIVNEIPAADVVEVKHGHIIETVKNGKFNRVFSCCGKDFTKLTQWILPKYCPNCGAKMNLRGE